jgi:tRNA A37 methylthiotransferase MiaB
MDGQLPQETKKERLARLIEVHHRTLQTKLLGMVGRTMDVLIERYEGVDPGYSFGRASSGRVAAVEGWYAPGSVVLLTVTGLEGHTLYGVPHKEA